MLLELLTWRNFVRDGFTANRVCGVVPAELLQQELEPVQRSLPNSHKANLHAARRIRCLPVQVAERRRDFRLDRRWRRTGQESCGCRKADGPLLVRLPVRLRVPTSA